MAVAQTPELEEIHDDAAQLVRDAGPVELHFVPTRLARIRDALVRDTLGRSLDEATRWPSGRRGRRGRGGPAWSRYLERAIDDDRVAATSRRGAPAAPHSPRPSCGTGRCSPSTCGTGSTRSPVAPEPTRQALLAIRLADITARCGLHETSDGAHLLRTAQVAVDRCAAPVLLDAADAPALLDALGPLDEATQDVVVRPALAPAVDRVPRPRGDRVSRSVMRWLFPEPPSPPGVEEIFGAGGDPTASCASWRHRSRASCRHPSAFALLALADAVADLPATPVPAGSRAGPRERWNG